MFLEIYIHIDIPQFSGYQNAFECVSCESADGFDNDHIYLAAFALPNQLFEFVTLFHAGAGDPLVGINAYELPSGFPVDAVGVVIHLIFIAVELFILLGGYAAVGRHSLGDILCAVYVE